MPYKDQDKRREYAHNHYSMNKEQYAKSVAEGRLARHALITQYKSAKKCLSCPESDIRCLDFHHRPGETKLFAINEGVRNKRTIEAIEAEIRKCDLVCANCHRKHHNAMRWIGACQKRGNHAERRDSQEAAGSGGSLS